MSEIPETPAVAGPRHWWDPPVLAWSFLTALPAPWIEADPASLAVATAYFPVIGIVLGAVLGALGLLFDRVLPTGPVAALLLSLAAVVTGGLHLDGLMDTADGVFGGRTRESRLEIMRDSRVGSFGALAGTLNLLVQFACLSDLTGVSRLVGLALALGLGRWSMVIALHAFRPARETGLGAAFRSKSQWWPLLAATVIAGALGGAVGWPGIAALVAIGVFTLLAGRYLTARLGGLTGDTYGAIAVLSESIALLVTLALETR